MKKPDIAIFILHIADACEKIQLYLKPLAQAEFMQNQMVQDAVIRNFEVIGEASKHITEDFRMKYPQINWRGMAGLRDILIHEYFGIDLVNVWNISMNSIPETLEMIKAIPEYMAARAAFPCSENFGARE